MDYLLTVDIAHPPLRGGESEKLLDEMIRRVRLSAQWRGLKIIHGYGKSGAGGSLKQTVRNWAYRNKRSIRGAIPGEEYSIHHGVTLAMRKECGQIVDPDLDRANPGVTIVWVK